MSRRNEWLTLRKPLSRETTIAVVRSFAERLADDDFNFAEKIDDNGFSFLIDYLAQDDARLLGKAMVCVIRVHPTMMNQLFLDGNPVPPLANVVIDFLPVYKEMAKSMSDDQMNQLLDNDNFTEIMTSHIRHGRIDALDTMLYFMKHDNISQRLEDWLLSIFYDESDRLMPNAAILETLAVSAMNNPTIAAGIITCPKFMKWVRNGTFDFPTDLENETTPDRSTVIFILAAIFASGIQSLFDDELLQILILFLMTSLREDVPTTLEALCRFASDERIVSAVLATEIPEAVLNLVTSDKISFVIREVSLKVLLSLIMFASATDIANIIQRKIVESVAEFADMYSVRLFDDYHGAASAIYNYYQATGMSTAISNAVQMITTALEEANELLDE